MTRIKLCGLQTVEDIETASRLKPDFIGFVFEPKSRRYITKEQAEKLKAKTDPAICTVGVFTDQPEAAIVDLIKAGIIDGIQLHGKYDPKKIEGLRKKTDAFLIQAFQIKKETDIELANACPADMVLLDAGKGSGTVFDWKLLEKMKRPYILAGGLDPDNAAEAVELYDPWGVDVSSGIETAGKKDPAKMADFCRQVRKEH